MLLLNKNKNKVSSRRQIRIKEVKDGTLVLPDNEYRIIVETSSINFFSFFNKTSSEPHFILEIKLI